MLIHYGRSAMPPPLRGLGMFCAPCTRAEARAYMPVPLRGTARSAEVHRRGWAEARTTCPPSGAHVNEKRRRDAGAPRGCQPFRFRKSDFPAECQIAFWTSQRKSRVPDCPRECRNAGRGRQNAFQTSAPEFRVPKCPAESQNARESANLPFWTSRFEPEPRDLNLDLEI